VKAKNVLDMNNSMFKSDCNSKLLIAALQSSPFRDVDIEPRREPMPVRDIPCEALAGQMNTDT
jgi:hypothetical protein